MDSGETQFVVIVLVYAVGGYWIITYKCEKIWQYKCVHDKAYFNVLFGSEFIVNGYHI